LKLRHVSLIGGVILSLVIFAGHLLFSNYVIQSGFSELERRHAMTVIDAAVHQIQDQLTRLDALAWDWATWDDTYAFVLDGNPQYIESNLPDSIFTDQSLCALIIRRTNRIPTYARTITHDGEENRPLLERLNRLMEKEMPILGNGAGGRGGLIYLDGEFHLVVERSILTSEGKGPSRGVLIMSRPLTTEIIETMGRNIGAPVHIELSKRDNRPIPEKDDRIVATDDTVTASAEIRTLGGRPVSVSVTLDRDMTRYGRKVAAYNSAIIALAMLLFCSGAYLLLHFKLFRRLERLDGQVSAIRSGKATSGAVSAPGSDELSALADSITGLLAEIDRSHKEQLAQAEAIASNERFLNQVLNSLDVGILLIDPETRVIVDVNDHALRLAERPREEVQGQICHRLTCPAALHDCPILDRGQPCDRSRRELLTKSGTTIPIMKSVSHVNRNGRKLLLETIVDITEIEQSRLELERIRQGLEEMVEARTRELAQANRELVALDKAKSLVLSSASHELRTPLTSILGFIKLMEKRFGQIFLPRLAEDETLRPKAEQFAGNLAVVRSESERLGRLVNDLLDLNKIESGRMDWRDARVTIAALLDRAATTIAGEAAGHDSVSLVIEPAPDGLAITADADRIQQVLINLLNNAFKFTDEGEVRLSVAERNGFAEFRVSDTGLGIPKEDQAMVFDIFYQVPDEGRSAERKFGTGLGLAICRQIVTHYGGEISVESEPGKGSTFRFTIPAATAEA